MKLISCLLVFLFSSCACSEDVPNPPAMYPPFKLIKAISEKTKPVTGLVLCAYGINFGLPKGYGYKNGIGNFRAGYCLKKSKKDYISLDCARCFIVYLAENFLMEINSDPKVIPDLDVYPFVSDLLDISIHFVDENRIDLGQGVATVHFSNGKIAYQGCKIEEYRNKFPASGRPYPIHEEAYAEALEIVKEQLFLK